MNKTFIHCGSEHFDKSIFEPIKNRPQGGWLIKPYGGIWGCPIDSEYSWREWCLANDFNTNKLKQSFLFKLTDSARILFIDSIEVLDRLYSTGYRNKHSYSPFYREEYCLDFEKLSNDFDAIIVMMDADIYWALYGWDVDSILILNPDCVVEIS